MASSRIFIKGLPPSLTEQDFKKHFSANSKITDAKLIPHRRIGYVGFKTPEEAENAVKYFNKSFIRMSKLAVEIARPISDPELPTSRKLQREQAREAQKASKEHAAKVAAETESLKRKRTEADENDPKLQEFLEVMQPASKTRKRSEIEQHDAKSVQVKPVAMPEAESDDEYEMVPTKSKVMDTLDRMSPVPAKAAVPQPEVEAHVGPEVAHEPSNAATTDADEWQRLHTSRLLDVVDPDELPAPISQLVAAPTAEDESPVNSLEIQAQPQPIVDDQPDNLADMEALVEETDATIESIKRNGRLFIRNLPYSATEEDIRECFSKYGDLEEAHLCLDSAGVSKGFSFIQFEKPEAAAAAFENLDGEPFQGRLIQILPATSKKDNKIDEFAISKLPLKKQKEIKRKQEAGRNQWTWNSLYMSQDAVNASMANRLGVSKSELLDPTSADAGVKQAIAETSIIQEAKNYFKKNGVDLEAFKRNEVGDTAILAKNFPYGTSLEELRTMFEEYGQVVRVLMPSTGTIAIVEFAQAPQARAAYNGLAYRKMGASMLFLQKAPRDLFKGPPVADTSDEVLTSTGVDAKVSVDDLLEGQQGDNAISESSTLFVRNLAFSTSTGRLTELFKPLNGFLSAKVKTKTDAKRPGQILSMGFGFVEFQSKADASAALNAMNGYALDGHKLLIKSSHKGLDAVEERKKEDNAKKTAGKRTKVIVKNLPFEASKADVRSLLGNYGKLRSVRVPKKFDNSARGFAFAEFVSPREAENALSQLSGTHLLGRHLVIEYASEDVIDAEEEIEKMQSKVGKQVKKVELQKLTGGGRKRFDIQGDGDDE